MNSMTRRTVTSNIAISSSGTVTGNSSVNATQNNSMRDTPALTGFTVQIPESRENGGLNQPLLRDLGLGASAKTSSGAVAASIMTRGVGTLLWQVHSESAQEGREIEVLYSVIFIFYFLLFLCVCL